MFVLFSIKYKVEMVCISVFMYILYNSFNKMKLKLKNVIYSVKYSSKQQKELLIIDSFNFLTCKPACWDVCRTPF